MESILDAENARTGHLGCSGGLRWTRVDPDILLKIERSTKADRNGIHVRSAYLTLQLWRPTLSHVAPPRCLKIKQRLRRCLR